MESSLENKKILDYKKAVLCCAAGLLSASAFPKLKLFFFIWVSFVPLISVIMESKLTSSFFYGFLSGFAFNAIGLYWLAPMLYFNTGSYIQAITASCFFWGYLALYWGVWSFGLQKYVSFQKDKRSNFFTVTFGSCLWVLLEYLRTYLFTGFPWMLIGYSQFEFTEIIQAAEFAGVYGVSFLIMFCNLCFYFWLADKNKKKYLYTALIFIILFTLFGACRIYKFRLLGEKGYNVLIFQPNIDQYKKWDEDYRQEILSNLQKQAVEVGKSKADLALWPETVLPGVVPEDRQLYGFTKKLAASVGSFNIFGSFYNEDNGKMFNVVLGFKGADDYNSVHKKNHLVPFGEFVPFRKFLAKFFGILNKMGDVDRGSDATVFNNGELFIGASICSENFFPYIARRFVLNGAKVLTNHTNDAWFFDTAAPYQHFIMNVFRAVENRKFVLVSANTGVSGIIEASGIIIDKTKVSKKELLNGTFFQNNFKTFYTKLGDVFVKICSVVLLVLVVFLRFKRRISE
ncbi:MAG: apolipoprotein N-acyltransferase [Endomicrobium sp.]|jgi:apolipoprotein N-acyltransferase|nr:apolipoprotein N-acyltransferase [Endomicrobium sp.]